MSDANKPTPSRAREILTGRLLLLGFGLSVLGFLVAVDRPDWFAIRPATGTSIAMANASHAAAPLNSEAAEPR
ncbi:hypothetical protein GGR39_000421 [Novosphingobium fluoreni]|uniref:Uncharacterized protein n=1 Tax=Novosphingobium fluoreni TaxID=1391222 RepID=A0A7W6FY52_9SPHN|nr:hypothetical protein [Novosphingobium fluoreni]MBB3938792.1 hypothetical protein [Novosphingobium fluoreni]